MRKWMGIIAAIALATWLAVPAVRIWRDPGLRAHHHTLGGLGATGPVDFVVESPAPVKRTRLRAGMIVFDHRSTFFACYRAMLLGGRWPPGEACPEWVPIRHAHRIGGTGGARPVDRTIEADTVSISL